MVRVSLPYIENANEINAFYEAMAEKYFACSNAFINSKETAETYFLDVCYELDEDKENIKIKRLTTLKASGKTLKYKAFTDTVNKKKM